MKVVLVHPNSGERKYQKIGWSWTIFFFSGFFAIPLFIRRLYGWAFLILALMIVSGAINSRIETDPQSVDDIIQTLELIISMVLFVLMIYLSIKGNALAGRKYLRNGWVFADPASGPAGVAMAKWGLRQEQVISSYQMADGRRVPSPSLPPRERPPESAGDRGSRRDSGGKWICTNCGNTNPLEAAECLKCGKVYQG